MDTPSSIPSRSDLLDQIERIFGSRSPDFEVQAERLQQLRHKVQNERGEQFAEEWHQVFGRPLELARLAYDRWQDLDDKAKRHIIDDLQSADPIGPEMSYLSTSD